MNSDKRQIIANVDRLHQLMDQHGFSAVVVRSGKNFTYLSGVSFPGTLARHLDFPDSPREVLLVWPRHGEPVMILSQSNVPVARRDSWFQSIEVCEGYVESPYGTTAAVLRRLGLHESTLGFEKAYISAARWEEVHRLLPKAQIADCTKMMAEVRWIKTPGEVEVLRKAADLLDEAYLEVFPTVKEGETERAVHSRIVEGCIRLGAQWAHGMLNSSRNTLTYCGEGDMAFQRGDIIRNDYASYYLGYPGHQSRTVFLGAPSAEQRRTYGIMRDIYRATLEQCRAGMRARAIYDFAAQAFRQRGYGDPVFLVGHGVGPWMHQQEPYIISTSEEVLDAGMVLAMEPHVGYWHLQDLILITDDAPKLLSARFSTDEMFVVG